MTATRDIAVVGSGFAGSLLAMIARRLGHSVVLLEKGTHPRFVIGESSTPLSNLLLEELATRYDLPSLRPLAKWGSWQQAHAEIACGLKRGFSFFHHTLGQPFPSDPEHREQLLVAASPHNQIADTHWYRADFDHLLVGEAQKIGVDYLDRVQVQHVSEGDQHLRLSGNRDGRLLEICARFVIDATGPRGFLHHTLRLGERELPGYPPTQALFSHFSGVRHFAEVQRSNSPEIPPYPIDDAAMHHLFDGGWAWVLRFNNGIVSAGLSATDALAVRLRLAEGEPAWRRLLDLVPSLRDQFLEARTERPFVHLARLSFRSARLVGSRWAQLPSAAGFVDPLLSTGFPLTLLGVSRLAGIIERDWDAPEFAARLRDYAEQTDKELLTTAQLIAALYASMSDFPLFSALTLLYFAAASYAEAARRLGKPERASSFLLCDDPVFGPACAGLCERALRPLTKEQSAALQRDILLAIEPFNVAGLGRPDRRNWYPVEAGDLLENAGKLGVTQEEVRRMLRRSGFQP